MMKNNNREKTTTNVLIEQVPVGSYKNFSYIVSDRSIGEAAVFDPAWDVPKLLGIVEKEKLKVIYIINTHAHMDHIQGNSELAQATGAKIVMSFKSLARKDIGVKDGEELKIGNVLLRFIMTPGHSPESMCILVDNRAIITGDTLFIGECGRVDGPGGSPGELYDSFEKLRKLEGFLTVYPGHDYGSVPSTSLREQFDTNYTLAKRSKEEFVRFMLEP